MKLLYCTAILLVAATPPFPGPPGRRGPESAVRRPLVQVDGNLEDLERVAQGIASDPCNDVFPLCRSGTDFTSLYVYYDVALDRLVLGLDLMDVEEGETDCLGLRGPGVPGDVDGDADPNDDSDFPECQATDTFGVGPEEYYMVVVDTEQNGRFGDREDLWIVYRDNMLRFEDGRGNPLAMRGRVALGVAGAPFDPGIPNQNLATEDIEIAVEGYGLFDPDPFSFGVQVLSGSTFGGPPDDTLAEPLIFDLLR